MFAKADARLPLPRGAASAGTPREWRTARRSSIFAWRSGDSLGQEDRAARMITGNRANGQGGREHGRSAIAAGAAHRSISDPARARTFAPPPGWGHHAGRDYAKAAVTAAEIPGSAPSSEIKGAVVDVLQTLVSLPDSTYTEGAQQARVFGVIDSLSEPAQHAGRLSRRPPSRLEEEGVVCSDEGEHSHPRRLCTAWECPRDALRSLATIARLSAGGRSIPVPVPREILPNADASRGGTPLYGITLPNG